MNFIVLYKSADNPTADWQFAGEILDLKADEGERAISEASTRGEGRYIALPVNSSSVEKDATATLELHDPADPEMPDLEPTGD